MLVETVSPLSGSIGNVLEVNIQVVFDTLINSNSINDGSFVLVQKKTVDLDNFFNTDAIAATMPIGGSFNITTVANGTKSQVTFNPRDPLLANAEYQVILSTDIEDLLGVHLNGIYSWKFMTGSGALLEPPAEHSDIAISPYPQTTVTLLKNPRIPFQIIEATPKDLATNQSLPVSIIVLEFSKPIDESSLSDATMTVVSEAVDGDSSNAASGLLSTVIEVDPVQSNLLNIAIDLSTTPLFVNNRIVTTIRNLKATDGSLVALPCVHTWTTTYTPRYASHIMVKVECGVFIKDVPDDTINMSLYLGSKEADIMVPYGAVIDPKMADYFTYCKAMYAKYFTCINLLTNSGAYGYKRRSKKLGELEVAQELSNLEELVKKFEQELHYYSAEILNLCYSPLRPQMTTKGALDPDAPVPGRDYFSQPMRPPILNAKTILPGSRRKRSSYRQPWLWYPSVRDKDYPEFP